MEQKIEKSIDELSEIKNKRLIIEENIKKLEDERNTKYSSIEEKIKNLSEKRTEFYNKFSDFFKKD